MATASLQKRRDESPSTLQQRLAALPSADDLPDLPTITNGKFHPTDSPGNLRTNGQLRDRNQNSFPFAAPSGTAGPQPTNAAWSEEIEIPIAFPNGGTATPPRRRSVQFARDEDEIGSLRKTQTLEHEETPQADAAKGRQGSFLGKLKALTSPGTPTHGRGQSGSAGFATPTAALSPQSERSEPIFPASAAISEAGAEADGEVDTDEERAQDAIRARKKMKQRRPAAEQTDTAPGTPMTARFASFIRDHHLTSSNSHTQAGPSFQGRRATMSDIGEDQHRAGVSEDEGRDRIKNAWRRGIEGARGLSYANRKHPSGEDAGGEHTPDGQNRRPHALRRITNMGDGPAASAQRWRQVKAGLKLIGQKKKDERTKVDFQKSAQLMAEVMSGAPAALFLASMYQRDEHGHRKIPVLLEQLKVTIPKSQTRTDKQGDRHLVFTIELEYGNGPARMKWQVQRGLRDFFALHTRYKTQMKTGQYAAKVKGETTLDLKRAKMPKFPGFAVPFARSVRGLFQGLEAEDFAQEVIEQSEAEGGAVSGTEGGSRPGMQSRGHTRRRSSFALRRRTSSGIDGTVEGPGAKERKEARERDLYFERQRKELEDYLRAMIRWLIFRPDSTRLCKFLELSALAIRLSAEGGYQGKQGLLRIMSRTNNHDLRKKPLKMMEVTDRAKRYWFLVRHSYVVCVDGPESLLPYDVFLVDSDFRIGKKGQTSQKKLSEQSAGEAARSAKEKTKHHLTIRLYNAERKLKLFAKNDRLYLQFMESLQHMHSNTIWANKKRFGSFAPVRKNVWARWLVDGRDHMWQVSRAIDNAKDFVYIHDWWLSPELYLRRPAAISHKWRLDRLLKRKAEQGVKIFVIVYRNIESAIPIDSEYTKWSLLDLHENICVQRSPNQFRQNQFFWAHHEKLVVVDNMMAFVGGVDLCFGRWDEPCHSLTDDKLTGFELDQDVPRDAEHCQVWPGKDYSNPRVQDFYALDRPYEEMYDRTKVPRMPWHDIAMQIVGQPARDVGRHFVQRWNYVLRQRIPSRPTPVLLPPPEFAEGELESLGMDGTCEIQILRSCSPWSIGTPNKVEHSIMNAYCSLIEQSEHFVHIENQFYISSCTVEGTTIHNRIGDALVERAIRAHEDGENWKACLIIPLMPGFQNAVDSQDGTSVRLIMQCQYRSICRGETSIFGRLRAVGIDPEDYIRFYSLRQWGKIGPRKALTTEQLYIHAKCMIVDDRSVIIGSANINERSMLGSRDSEVAACVRDTRMVDSVMGGKPYRVGVFAHTLRKRLMREHLGIDVDAIYQREQVESERELQDAEMERIYRDDEEAYETPPDTPRARLSEHNLRANATTSTVDQSAPADVKDWVSGQRTASIGTTSNATAEDGHKKRKSVEDRREQDVEGYGFDNMKELVDRGDNGLRDTYIDSHGHERLLRKEAPDFRHNGEEEANRNRYRRNSSQERRKADKLPSRPPWPMERNDTYALGLAPRSQLPELPVTDDTDIGGPALVRTLSKPSSIAAISPLLSSLRRPEITEDCMSDPISAVFYEDIWSKVAENNTKLYRQVFRCMPDSEVLDWKRYEQYNDYNERFMASQGLGTARPRVPKEAPGKSGPPGSGGTDSSMAFTAAKGRERSRSLFSGLGSKRRPASRASTSTVAAGAAESDEKFGQESPAHDNASVSGPTAVATPDSRATDSAGAPNGADGPVTASALDNEKLSPIDANNTSNNDFAPDAAGVTRRTTIQYSDSVNPPPAHDVLSPTSTSQQQAGVHKSDSTKQQQRRRRATTKSSARPPGLHPEEVLGREEAEELLKLVQGHLVQWPYDWLEKEEKTGNWLYNIDQIAPLEIYD
ncbi:phospholipase D [Polychaeton citri CBS 116435]|uniref:Phospholipase D1 n=1 Tax=Polychaeton citri CBS 116435 TaxID=1314669 RepID=A0A9P4UNA1_9PEZI|nr:phospholipase D [Polychaeton citri CBS 116435]